MDVAQPRVQGTGLVGAGGEQRSLDGERPFRGGEVQASKLQSCFSPVPLHLGGQGEIERRQGFDPHSHSREPERDPRVVERTFDSDRPGNRARGSSPVPGGRGDGADIQARGQFQVQVLQVTHGPLQIEGGVGGGDPGRIDPQSRPVQDAGDHESVDGNRKVPQGDGRFLPPGEGDAVRARSSGPLDREVPAGDVDPESAPEVFPLQGAVGDAGRENPQVGGFPLRGFHFGQVRFPVPTDEIVDAGTVDLQGFSRPYPSEGGD